MTDKKISIVYDKDGVSLRTENLTESEKSDAQSLFNDGERDPGVLRESIGIE